MTNLYTPDEFVSRVVGLPWKRWACSWEQVDCYGLVVLYHREVLGIDLGAVPETDIEEGFSTARGWEECNASEGATCFMTWRAGAPTHCGLLLAGDKVLHAEAREGGEGSVRVTRLSVLEKFYGGIRFYRYTPC